MRRFYFLFVCFVIAEKNLPHNMPDHFAGNINNSASDCAELGGGGCDVIEPRI